MISDVEEDSSEEVFEDCEDFEVDKQSIEFRENNECDGHSKSISEDENRSAVRLNIGHLVGSMAIDNEEKDSLKQLLTSLSEEKEHIEDRIHSAKFLNPDIYKHRDRSCSF